MKKGGNCPKNKVSYKVFFSYIHIQDFFTSTDSEATEVKKKKKMKKLEEKGFTQGLQANFHEDHTHFSS